jgi:hypothetical protein
MTEVVAIRHLSNKALIGIIILSAVVSFVGTLWHAFLPTSARCIIQGFGVVLSEPGEMTGLGFLMLLWVWPLLLLSPTISKKIDAKTLTYIYVVGFCVSGFSNVLSPWCNFLYFVGSKGTSASPGIYLEYIPSIVAVPANVADSLILGGIQNIPWGTWLPAMIWYFLYTGLFAIISVAVANIFRHEWIDVEKVVFPQTMLASETLIQISRSEVSTGRRRFFFIGLIAGVLITIPLAMIIIFPWFPDIYGWRSYNCGPGALQLSPDSALYGLPIAIQFAKHPLAFALAYLLPMSVLFSTWLFALIYVILVYAAYALGFYTALTTTGSCGRLWCGDVSPLMSSPLMLRAVSGGTLMGLGVMTLFFQRRYIGMTLKAALGRINKDEILAIEKDEPMSYRNSWAMLAIGFILLVALLTGTGFSFGMAFLMVFLGILIWIWQTRLFGLAGLHIEGSGAVNWVPRLLFFYQVPPANLSTDYALGNLVWSTQINRHPLDGWGQSMFSAFGSYRMASLTGTSSKDVFKVVMISLLVSQFVGLIAFVYGASSFGVSRLHGTESLWASSMEFWINSGWSIIKSPGSGPPEAWAGHFILGILLAIIMSALHARFVWFPHPIGPVIAFNFAGVLQAWWFAFFVAWILKTLTLRIGGSRLYEQMGQPLAGGITAGYVLIAFVFGIAGIIRFFYPY